MKRLLPLLLAIPLGLTVGGKADLVAFLRSLTDRRFLSAECRAKP
jgi:hypothetical protein